jgi:hypothetical protein
MEKNKMNMSIIKLFYPKNSLKRKIYDIESGLKRIVRTKTNEKFWIAQFGAYDIDPKHLLFCVCLVSDREKNRLKQDVELLVELRELLVKHEYPDSARQLVKFEFESQETVDRDAEGKWWLRFK